LKSTLHEERKGKGKGKEGDAAVCSRIVGDSLELSIRLGGVEEFKQEEANGRR